MARSPSKTRPSAGAPVLAPDLADLRALAHPLRLRMMELFAESPKTTKQVAGILGQPPTRLYHHVAALERAGLLVLKETRRNRGAIEKWYGGISQQLQMAPGKKTTTAKARRARRAVAATVLEQAKQELIAVRPGSKDPALLARLVIAARPSEIAAIRKRMYESVAALRTEYQPDASEDAAEGCERWALTVAFAPAGGEKGSR